MSLWLPTRLDEGRMVLYYPDYTASVSSASDESIDTNIAVPPETRGPREHILAQTQTGNWETGLEMTEELVESLRLQELFITNAGAWAPHSPKYPGVSNAAHTHAKPTSQNLLTSIRPTSAADPVVDMHHLDSNHIVPANDPTPANPASPSEKLIDCRSPGSEPSLVSDHTSMDETSMRSPNSCTAVSLESLALAIFKFWPAGVAIYSGHTATSQSPGNAKGTIPSNKSSQGSGQNEQAANRGDNIPPTRKDGSFGRQTKSSRSITRNIPKGAPIPKNRCLMEAGYGIECCVGHPHFDDMLRHSVKHHGRMSQNIMYNGKTFVQHIEDLKIRLKTTTDEGREIFAVTLFTILYPDKPIPYLRFDQVSPTLRRPHPPPTEHPLVMPTPVTMESGLVEAPVDQTTRQTFPQPSHTATDAGSEDLNQREVQARTQIAIPKFAMEMESDPLFAMGARTIENGYRTYAMIAQVQRENINFQLSSKRKELEADAIPSVPDERAKRARYEMLSDEAIIKLKAIDTELKQRTVEAGQKMQDLYDGMQGGSSSSISVKANLQRQLPETTSPRSAISTADVSDSFGFGDLAHIQDPDFNFSDFFDESYSSAMAAYQH